MQILCMILKHTFFYIFYTFGLPILHCIGFCTLQNTYTRFGWIQSPKLHLNIWKLTTIISWLKNFVFTIPTHFEVVTPDTSYAPHNFYSSELSLSPTKYLIMAPGKNTVVFYSIFAFHFPSPFFLIQVSRFIIVSKNFTPPSVNTFPFLIFSVTIIHANRLCTSNTFGFHSGISHQRCHV